MTLPARNHFSLDEVAERWGVTLRDIRYYAQHEKLEVQTWLGEDVVVRLFHLKNSGNDDIKIVRTGVASYKGYAIVEPEELREIFRSREARTIKKFRALNKKDLINICDDTKNPVLSVDDLVVSKEERDRFERMHNIECCCRNVSKSAAPLSFSGRPSVMYQITAHFKERCKKQEVMSSLQKEGDYLFDWASKNINDMQVPKSGSIMNAIRQHYRDYAANLKN